MVHLLYQILEGYFLVSFASNLVQGPSIHGLVRTEWDRDYWPLTLVESA